MLLYEPVSIGLWGSNFTVAFCIEAELISYESQRDLLAKEPGFIFVRLRTNVRVGSITAAGQVLTGSVPLEECLAKVALYFQGKEGIL